MAFIPDEQTAGFIPDEPSGFIPDKPELPTGGGLAEFGKSFVKGTMDVGKGLLGTIQTMHPDPLARYIMKPKVAEAKRKIASAQERFPVTHRGAEAWVGRVLGGAIPYMGAALAGGAAVGPVGAAVVGFSVEGDNAYDDAIASGASENQAQTERLVVGSINAGIEAWQIGKIMKFAKSGKHSLKNFIRLVRKKSFKKAGKLAKNFGADVLRLSLEEGLEEFSQEGVSLGVPAAFRGERPTKPDGTTDWLAVGERLGEAALGGAVAGPILGGGMRVLTGQGGTAQPAPQDIPPGSNVYQTDKGRIVIETPSDIGDKASQKTELKDGLVIDKATGETLTQVTEGTVSGRLDAPKLGKTKIPAFVIEPDEVKTNEPEFSEPGMAALLTSKRMLMRRIGAEPLTGELTAAKEAMMVLKGNLNKGVNKVIKSLRKQASFGDRIASKIMNRQTEPVRRMVDLLDTHETLPQNIAKDLSPAEVKGFNDLRYLTKWLLQRTNIARQEAGLSTINDLKAYIPHWTDSVANDLIEGKYPFKSGYLARLMKNVPKRLTNRTAFHRELSRKIQDHMEQDLGRLMKGLISYDLHDMFLTNPQAQVWDELHQLQKDGKIPDSTYNAIADFINYDILNKQAKLDRVFNDSAVVKTSTELINRVLRPLNREINNPAAFYFGGMRKLMHAAFMPFRPRPATRNLGQRLLNLTFFRARDLLRAQFGRQDQITDPETGEQVKVLDLVRKQDWYKLTKPEDILNDRSLLSRLTSFGMIGFKRAHVGNRYISNVEVSALTAYYDWKFRFNESHNTDSKYYKRIADHSKKTGIPIEQLQTQQEDMMNDIRDGVQMTQWEYMSHGMPTLFRGQTARGIAAYQSWWMNYFMSHTAEGWNRIVTGRTRVRGDGTGGRLLTRGARYRAVKGMGAIYGMAKIAKGTLGIAMLGALFMPDPTDGLPPILNLAITMARLILGSGVKRGQAWKDLKKQASRLLPLNNAARDAARVGDDWTLKDYIFYTENDEWKQIWIKVEPKEEKIKKGVLR